MKKKQQTATHHTTDIVMVPRSEVEYKRSPEAESAAAYSKNTMAVIMLRERLEIADKLLHDILANWDKGGQMKILDNLEDIRRYLTEYKLIK